MSSNEHFKIYFIFLVIVSKTAALSYNLPTFCPAETWETNAVTYANAVLLGYWPFGLFIDKNNAIYTTNYKYSRVLVWNEGSATPIRILQSGLAQPVGIFVTDNGDIYVDNGAVNGRVEKWSRNATKSVPAMTVSSSCFGLFVDVQNNLYCSMQYKHQVLQTFLNGSANMTTMIAGTGISGSAPGTLNRPNGIYVDTNLDLYVADTGNNRIQLFQSGQKKGLTVVGSGANGTITLSYPTGVTMDGNGYLYIVNGLYGGIIRSGPNGYRCVIGCSGTVGWGAWQLYGPYQMAFDRYGDIFVMDHWNSRLQKFASKSGSCVFYNQPKLCSNTTWLPDAITFADRSVINTASHGFFIDLNDKIYFPDNYKREILVWSSGSLNVTSIPARILDLYTSVFVTSNEDVYFENGNGTGRIDKWPMNATNSSFVTKFNDSCYALFIGINNMLYCSMQASNQIVANSLQNASNTSVPMAGNGIAGSAADQLYYPYGIFVSMNSDLYVADAANNRIQLFPYKNLNGTTVAGNGTPNNLILSYPTDVVLDADGYLFIADNDNNRIIRVGPTDFQCVAGCSGRNGSAADELHKPYALRFDSQGNIYVADEFNGRIQKFIKAGNGCVEFFSIPIIAGSCPDPFMLGVNCNNSNSQCDLTQPCRNNGTCNNVNTTAVGYTCTCPAEFNGSQCQYDNRLCTPNTCWHNSTCEELTNMTFVCHCESGWTGLTCQTMINYCQKTTCENHGVCSPLLRDYRCECLGESYSGRHCEITTTKLIVYKTTAKSFASVAISFLVSALLFIITMDVLKYGLGIDVTHEELRSIRMKHSKQKRAAALIRHKKYVNALPKVKPVYIIRKLSF